MKTEEQMISDTLETMYNRKDAIKKALVLIPKIQEVNNAYDGKIMSARYTKAINALDSGLYCKIEKFGNKKYLSIHFQNSYIQNGKEYKEGIMMFHSIKSGYEEDCITLTEDGKYRMHSKEMNECLEELELHKKIELSALDERISKCSSVIEELSLIRLQLLLLEKKAGGWKYYKQACDSLKPMFDVTSY